MTPAELAAWLDPPWEERKLRLLIRALGLRPAGSAPAGPAGGKPVATYDVGLFQALHADVMPYRGAALPPS